MVVMTDPKDPVEVTPKWRIDQKDQIHSHSILIHLWFCNIKLDALLGCFCKIPRQVLFSLNRENPSSFDTLLLVAHIHSPMVTCTHAHLPSPAYMGSLHTYTPKHIHAHHVCSPANTHLPDVPASNSCLATGPRHYFSVLNTHTSLDTFLATENSFLFHQVMGTQCYHVARMINTNFLPL